MVAERILIIDDSPIDARFASKILTEAGYHTTIIHDALEGLSVARQWQPDLILLDVTMPKMDGYQVCQQLKADPDTRDIATVLYTIRDQFIDCLRGIEAGADDFIVKTLSADDFLNHVRKILSERRTGATSPPQALDLSLIRPLANVQDQRALLRLLFGTFNKHGRDAMGVFMGAHVTSVLVDRALEKAAREHSFLRHIDQSHVSSLMFETEAIGAVATEEIVDGFQAFNAELYQLVTKLTRTRLNGVKEARAIQSAFQDMVEELHKKYQERREQVNGSTDQAEDVRGPWSVVPGSKADDEYPGVQDQGPRTPGPRLTKEPGTKDPIDLPDTLTRPYASSAAAPATVPERLEPDCTFDSSGHLIYSNDDLARVLGYSKVELMGRPLQELLTASGKEALQGALERLVEKGTALAKLQLKTKDGAPIQAEAQLVALYDSQGRFAMTRCGLRILPATELLQERDREIEQWRLALHNINEEFSQLASTISHDLRQPLHAILVLCQFLEEEAGGQLNESAHGYIRSIQQAGAKMKEMIEDLVHYARITSSSNAYEEVPLGRLLEQVKEKMTDTLAARRAAVHLMGELPEVRCDRERFTELLTELMTNAVKFNDKAPPVVEVGLVTQDAAAYTFYVKDNGIGIDEPYHESIFRLFHRLHPPEAYEGTGAGLAICRRIVESHGGRIWVRSQLGAGATVFFTLPRNPFGEIPNSKFQTNNK
jgi:PAS domain S-box-containing protein